MTAKTFADVQFEIANNYYAKQDYERAAPEYEKYLGLYQEAPNREIALFRLGESYRAMGNLNAAQHSYRTLLARYRNGKFVAPAAYRLGDLHFRAEEYPEAIRMFQLANARSDAPDVIAASRFYTARSMEKLGRRIEARGIYEQIAEKEGENPFREASLLALAQLLADTNRREEAVARFKKLAEITQRPDLKAEATVRAALLEIELGENERALKELQEALEMPAIGKWQEVARVGLIRVQYEEGKYEELLQTFTGTDAGFTDETRPEVLLIAANAHRQLGHEEEARKLYEALMAEYPDSRYADDAKYERLVSLYTADSPDLIAAVDEYLEANPTSVNRDRVSLLKAESLFRKGDYAAASQVYASLDRRQLPDDLRVDAMFKLGWCQMQTGHTEEAVATFSAFLRRYPDNKLAPSALAQRAIARQQNKQFAEALEDFSLLINDYPNASERELALQQKALIQGQQQDNAGMVQTFSKLLTDFPETKAAAQANYWIGWAAFEEKDYPKAITFLSRALELNEEEFRDRASLRVILANYYLEKLDAVAGAVDRFQESDTQQKVPVEIIRWLGMEYLKAEKYAEAEKYLAALRAEEIGDERDANDALNLGRAQLAQGEFERAVVSFDDYLAHTTQPYPKATGLLEKGRALLGLDRLDDADAVADETLALQPEGRLNAEGRMLKGDIALARRDFAAAARMLQSVSVVYDDPELTPRALEKSYQAYEKAGDMEKSKKVLNELQTRYPEYWQQKVQEEKGR